MNITYYSFGGELFKQEEGAGIGLRASACMAKILMGVIDKLWAGIQNTWKLSVAIFFRYIDDLRLYIFPISAGWYWSETGWEYRNEEDDLRSPIERTKEELAKSFNSIVRFITFTTESEEEFSNNFLPTLDFQTQV